MSKFIDSANEIVTFGNRVAPGSLMINDIKEWLQQEITTERKWDIVAAIDNFGCEIPGLPEMETFLKLKNQVRLSM